MPERVIFYLEGNLICIAILFIMLIHDRVRMDRQEKQIKLDRALMACICYFACDPVWMAMRAGVIKKTVFGVTLINFLISVIMCAITYTWLRFVMAVEQIPGRSKKKVKIAVALPFALSILALVVTYIIDPESLITKDFELRPLYNVFLVAVPALYMLAVLFSSIKRAKTQPNPLERRIIIYVGLIPVLVVAGGIFQMVFFPNLPIFCFCCALHMIIFYILSMDQLISTDPLTGLNNRGQLTRYLSSESSAAKDGKRIFIFMIDINDFKHINDTYGHGEGDRALVIAADTLRASFAAVTSSAFIARYGGDEVLIILESADEETVEKLVSDMRERIGKSCDEAGLPYRLSLSVGYDEVVGEGDTVQNCIKRADEKLYLDKEIGIKSGMIKGRR